MTIRTIVKASEKFVIDNSPGILTGLAVAGTVTTALLTGKASYSSALEIESQRDSDHPYEFSTKQKVEMVWRNFIPPAVVGVVTITSIIMANQIGSRRAAALAAAFRISEELSGEYKNRVTEALGKQKEEKIRSELAHDRMAAKPEGGMILVAGSEVLFFDELSGRYFKGEVENVKKAVNEINYQVNNYYAASLTEFYEKIGLPATQFSDEVGWNSDGLLEVQYTATLYEEGKPAIAISYDKVPIRGYDRCQ